MSELANIKMRIRAKELLLEVRKVDRFEVGKRRNAARNKYLGCRDLASATDEKLLIGYEKYLEGKMWSLVKL